VSKSWKQSPPGLISDPIRHKRSHMTTLSDILEEYEFLDSDDRYRLLIDLGRDLPPMPDALKIDATLVRGCSASVWVYPVTEGSKLEFMADSNAAITKGIIALVLKTVDGKPASDILATTIEDALAPFDLKNQLSSNRTQGIPNMIALIRETAARYAD
jgi:cysteine desulfuration protein SufE